MKTFQKIMACVLVLTMIFSFASCKNDDTNQQQNSTTTSTTEKENTTNAEPKPDEPITDAKNAKLTGTWIYDETVTPQDFYTDFYDSEITKTSINLRTTYDFNDDGTFSIGVSIMNISAVRKEYRALMVAAGRKNMESQGKMLTPDDVLYYENYADEVLKEICTAQKGAYTVDGNKIVYTTGDNSFYETFTLNGNKLTLTGSSVSNEGYPVTLLRDTEN